MNTTISNNGLPKFTQATGSSGNGPAPATTPAGSASAASQPDDQLKLTDSARALQQAARPDDAATVDPQRVERARQALADGSYKINPGRIADNMLSLERQIGGTSKA
ncbi:flagellar biosynthesis anti-sigma factor FlgM [Rhodanobacter koreensis]